MRLKGDYGAFYDVGSEWCLEDFWYFEFVNGFAVEVEDFCGCFAHGLFPLLCLSLEVTLMRR